MDNSLERDQLNLWDKLNRLYGENAEQEAAESSPPPVGEEPGEGSPVEPGESTEPAGSPGELGSSALEEVDMLGHEETSSPGHADSVNEVCADCRHDCKQPAGGFVISRCRLASGSSQENLAPVSPNQLAASQGSMGIEKINETCRRCRRSCKQRTAKLNKMLCLGFLPIDE